MGVVQRPGAGGGAIRPPARTPSAMVTDSVSICPTNSYDGSHRLLTMDQNRADRGRSDGAAASRRSARPSPTKARSRRRPTRWPRCSRTCRSRSASSRRSSAPSCSCAAAAGPCRPTAVRSCSSARAPVRRELDALRADLSMLQGLEVGDASFGVVGTASRWLVPELVADLRTRAPGVHLRVDRGRVGAARRRGAHRRAHAGDRHRTGRRPPSERRDDPGGGPGRASRPRPRRCRAARCRSPRSASSGSCSRSRGTRCGSEIEAAAAEQGITLDVAVEVEGIRLIADLVAAGAGASVLPGDRGTGRASRTCGSCRSPECHRVASRSINARDAYLSIADRAVRDSALRLTGAHRFAGQAGAAPARSGAPSSAHGGAWPRASERDPPRSCWGPDPWS